MENGKRKELIVHYQLSLLDAKPRYVYVTQYNTDRSLFAPINNNGYCTYLVQHVVDRYIL